MTYNRKTLTEVEKKEFDSLLKRLNIFTDYHGIKVVIHENQIRFEREKSYRIPIIESESKRDLLFALRGMSAIMYRFDGLSRASPDQEGDTKPCSLHDNQKEE